MRKNIVGSFFASSLTVIMIANIMYYLEGLIDNVFFASMIFNGFDKFESFQESFFLGYFGSIEFVFNNLIGSEFTNYIVMPFLKSLLSVIILTYAFAKIREHYGASERVIEGLPIDFRYVDYQVLNVESGYSESVDRKTKRVSRSYFQNVIMKNIDDGVNENSSFGIKDLGLAVGDLLVLAVNKKKKVLKIYNTTQERFVYAGVLLEQKWFHFAPIAMSLALGTLFPVFSTVILFFYFLWLYVHGLSVIGSESKISRIYALFIVTLVVFYFSYGVNIVEFNFSRVHLADLILYQLVAHGVIYLGVNLIEWFNIRGCADKIVSGFSNHIQNRAIEVATETLDEISGVKISDF